MRRAVVSDEAIRRIGREWRRWLWGAYRAMNLSLEDAAAEIGATRQGFSKLLRWPDTRFLVDTFLRGCFLRREVKTGFAIVVLARGTGLQIACERSVRISSAP